MAMDRALDHFIAREIAHDLTGGSIGRLCMRELPVWNRKGYADYIGSGGVSGDDETLLALLGHAPVMGMLPPFSSGATTFW